MSESKRVLLLVGSVKGLKSNSYAMGSYILSKLSGQGLESETVMLAPAMKNAEKQQELVAKVAAAQVVILVCPLYVDSLPAPVVQFMECVLAAQRDLRNTSFMAIVNCGFPESAQNQTALEICSHFAQQVGLTWLGGLPVGSGGAINSKPMEKIPGYLKKIRLALDLVADAVVAGGGVPAEAVTLLEKPLMANWMYVLGGHLGWHLMALQNKVWRKLRAQPYA